MAHKGRVEVVLANGNTVWVPEHIVKDMSKFGAVLSSQRTFRTPPRELLTSPIPRKIILPELEKKIPGVINTGAEYPGAVEPIIPDAIIPPVIPEVSEPNKPTVRKIARKPVKK